MLRWLFDLREWQFCLCVVFACVGFSLAGLMLAAPVVRRLRTAAGHNQIISYFLSTAGVFYGITLGLITVGAWQNYAETQERVSREAASLGALYRDVSCLPQPERARLQGVLRDYATFVIEKAWPAQRRGETPAGANQIMTDFQEMLVGVDAANEAERMVQSQAFAQFNTLIELRRLRLQAVSVGLPPTVWMVLILGAVVTLSFNWLFIIESRALHALLCALVSVVVGLLMFLTAAMDAPFHGDMGIGPDAFVLIRDHLMLPSPANK